MLTDLKELASYCKNLTLLYIEDDILARESTFKLLENFFLEVIIATDGEEGLEKYKSNTVDLILTDINMPKLNGLDMLEEIRKENRDIPVLILSAYNDAEYFMQAISLEIDGYILKPLVYDHLFRALYKSVEKLNLLASAKNYKENLEEEVLRRSEEIVHQLEFDSLTGLLSRYSFFRDIDLLDTPVILLIDIDKFKVINEVYGNQVGSKALKKFGGYLNKVIDDENSKIYRLSSDEFAIVDETKHIDPEKYETFITDLFRDLNNIRLKIDENIITIDITIGLSSVEHNSYESAKIALDYAKEHRKPYVMYSSAIDHRKESSLTLKVRDEISSAINDDRVIAVYQPIVDSEKKILKYETLMRLEEEETHKLVSPFYFLDVAVKTRLYDHLSSKVIFQAFDLIKSTGETFTVNLTYGDIKNVKFIDEIEMFFYKNKEAGTRTVFEITESQAIENYDDVKHFIQKFRSYGVKIAIDDFGSGFSNFEYILEIEPDYLKIDGSLIKDIDTDIKSYTLVEAILQFSHKLGIKVIAEYVHSEEIFELLKGLEVDEYQGFYFSEPLEDIGQI